MSVLKEIALTAARLLFKWWCGHQIVLYGMRKGSPPSTEYVVFLQNAENLPIDRPLRIRVSVDAGSIPDAPTFLVTPGCLEKQWDDSDGKQVWTCVVNKLPALHTWTCRWTAKGNHNGTSFKIEGLHPSRELRTETEEEKTKKLSSLERMRESFLLLRNDTLEIKTSKPGRLPRRPGVLALWFAGALVAILAYVGLNGYLTGNLPDLDPKMESTQVLSVVLNYIYKTLKPGGIFAIIVLATLAGARLNSRRPTPLIQGYQDWQPIRGEVQWAPPAAEHPGPPQPPNQ